jgi:hypothetical protein
MAIFAKRAAVVRLPQRLAFHGVFERSDSVSADDVGEGCRVVVCVKVSATPFAAKSAGEIVSGEYLPTPLAGLLTMPDDEHYRRNTALPCPCESSSKRMFVAVVARDATLRVVSDSPAAINTIRLSAFPIRRTGTYPPPAGNTHALLCRRRVNAALPFVPRFGAFLGGTYLSFRLL